MLQNKFNLNPEDNLWLVKKNLVDYIWKSTVFEGFNVTFPATSLVFDGFTSPTVDYDVVVVINNLKDTWRFLIETLEYPINFALICELNKRIGAQEVIRNAGYIRKGSVAISGTNWIPDIPEEEIIKEEIEQIMSIPCDTDRAVTLMLFCMRAQIFPDGNKRTSMLLANKILLENGRGVLTLPIEIQEEFRTHLLRFYETNSMVDIKKFIWDNCIIGE